MIQQFEGLHTEEQQLMVDAIPLITILIAGADGNIDTEELAWSEKITDIRAYSHATGLNDYYKLVGENFQSRIETLLAALPKETAARQEAVSGKLAGLNAVLPKMEFNFARKIYSDFTSFAEHVAKASGGFLGIGSVSQEESELISLPMIKPLNV